MVKDFDKVDHKLIISGVKNYQVSMKYSRKNIPKLQAKKSLELKLTVQDCGSEFEAWIMIPRIVPEIY